MELNITLKQSQTLSPQMMQSMEILQMNSQELLAYIEEAVQENPVLEAELPPAAPDPDDDLRRKLAWLDTTDVQNRHYYRQDAEGENDPLANYAATDDREETLYLYILSQLQALDLPAGVRTCACYIIESLDGNGWLDEDISQIAAATGQDSAVAERALEVVQALDPAGIAARSLSECLALQLRRRPGDCTLALRIVGDHLEQLGKNRYPAIATALGAPMDEVRRACDLIRSLNPRPGTGFAARDHLLYINPDVFVVSFPDHFEVLTNDYFFPTLGLSRYYCNMLKQSDEPEVKEYLSTKVRQAKWIARSIEQRRSTLLSCAECILDLQEAFFRNANGHLVPMSLADIAARLGVHESTVSRAIKGKYLQCAWGVYPIIYFFSRGLGDHRDGASPDRAKSLLRELVDSEDKKKPRSDQELSTLLAQQGVAISRRTVAKYRDELGLPSATGRRTYEN